MDIKRNSPKWRRTTMAFLVVVVVVLLLPASSEAAEILGLFAHPGKSHFEFFRPIFRELAGRGHNISMYSYFPLEQPLANYTDYVFKGSPLLTDVIDLMKFKTTERTLLGLPYKIPTYFMLHSWGMRFCQSALNSPLIADLLSSPLRYDLIILEHFANDCMTAVAHLLNAPVVALSTCAIMPWHYQRMGTPHINAIMPMNFLTYSDEMGLIDRLNNFIHFHTVNTLYEWITQPATDALISQRFGFGLPSVNEIVKNTSLMLINQHYALTGISPYAPNVVEVGGLQIGPQKPLPEHLEKLMEDSLSGVIYISWGSMVDPTTLPIEKRRALFKSIAHMKDYTFLIRWKSDKPLAQDKPSNLFTFDWLPQRDLLCHPRVKAFISHAGLLGTTEAVHCGVPMLVTPFFGDQFLNAGALAQRGFGVIVHFGDFDEQHITSGLQKILEKEFADKVRRSAKAFRERPQSPLELATWWIEHVIDTRGAPMLENRARHINWFVYNSIDVYLCCLAIIGLPLFAIWQLVRLLRLTLGLMNATKNQKTKVQ
ncbi:UDP-glucuronosyltransferase 1-3 [Drosophila guanche]|uniref:Blast:UDP-glucuronosyltransferase 1-3 n=1 Tax=Drosophila guanche TaxID=7266 RepID=A0A3B0JFP3_DROGU|nr:UDP-glucuronosyltransferase 1-3 [Drosophila guanche]SPP79042.1 blast:UDP-glucuronosyltransferase 1-3 [Drosophila guanche]